uniref:Ig-like domain-containing protein n=1 Tax=Scleropages formosus TaxID=113540 RepID=A0A8D0CJQ0_SCLFO
HLFILPFSDFPKPVVSILVQEDKDIAKKWLKLVCLVTASFESDIYVAWKKGEGPYEEGLTGEPVTTGSINSVTSIFTISREDWDKDTQFSCAAAQSFSKSYESPISKSTSKSHVQLPEKSCLDVTLKNPRARDLFLSKTAVLECVIAGGNVTDVEAANFNWTVDGKEKSGAKEHQIDSLRRSSVLSIRAVEWESAKSVECSVKQNNGVRVKKSIKAKTGNFPKPVVSILVQEDKDIAKKWLQLVCLVNVSFESDIYVAWKKGEGPYEEGLTGEPVKTGSFNFVTSIFNISKDDWDNGTLFSCATAQSFSKSDESPISKSTSKSHVGQEEKYPEVCVDEAIPDVNESDSPWYTALSFIILFLFTLVYGAFVSLHQVKQ